MMSVFNFLPIYLVNSAGLASTLASYMAGFIFLGAIFVNLFIGKLVDRWGPFWLLIGTTFGMSGFLFASTYIKTVWMFPMMLFLLGATISAGVPIQNVLLSSLSLRGRKGESYGIMMGIITVTNAVSPLLFGMVADVIGLDQTFRAASIPPILSGFLLFILMKMLISRKPEPVTI